MLRSLVLTAPLSIGLSLGLSHHLLAQCPAGELPVTITVQTDPYGNETFWQLVPTGNACGNGVLFSGGNATLDCNDAGTEVSPPGGYGNNATITTGPYCLTEDAAYDLIAMDSYGDDHASYTLTIDGAVIGQFHPQEGGSYTYTFTVQLPAARDMGITDGTTPLFNEVGLPVTITGNAHNFGAEPVTSFTLYYRIGGGAVQSAPITGVDIPSGGDHEFAHATTWTPAEEGTAPLRVWAGDINGGADLHTANDTLQRTLTVAPETPNIIDDLVAAPIFTQVANSDEDLLVPRDLDFHPDRSRDELWVINKDVEESGGSTVKFTHPGTSEQTHLWQRDPNAWHFMSLPTAIAMADNGNFSTAPGVYDANHDGGQPFTGPTLWSSDPAIYAQNLFGPLGSHLDMVHVHPRSQGIAHDHWNKFWVVDGTNGDVVMTNFRGDHGPGNDYHGNAIIHRYSEFTITRDPNDHIVSHCVLDKRTGWLYVVDNGGQRVLRLNTRTGTLGGPASPPSPEQYVEYRQVTGYEWEVLISGGLDQPAGIEVIGDRLLVSDHANGDIIVYDISGDGAPERGRIHTGSPGIMGIKVGPDGDLWYVNATTHQLVRVGRGAVGIAEARPDVRVHCYPDPAADLLFIANDGITPPLAPVELIDITGRTAVRGTVAQLRAGLDVSALAPGQYVVRVGHLGGQRIVVAR